MALTIYNMELSDKAKKIISEINPTFNELNIPLEERKKQLVLAARLFFRGITYQMYHPTIPSDSLRKEVLYGLKDSISKKS